MVKELLACQSATAWEAKNFWSLTHNYQRFLVRTWVTLGKEMCAWVSYICHKLASFCATTTTQLGQSAEGATTSWRNSKKRLLYLLQREALHCWICPLQKQKFVKTSRNKTLTDFAFTFTFLLVQEFFIWCLTYCHWWMQLVHQFLILYYSHQYWWIQSVQSCLSIRFILRWNCFNRGPAYVVSLSTHCFHR